MTSILELNQGRIQGDQFVKFLQVLDDGKYFVKFTKLDELKTVKEWQERYFAMIDTIVSHSGWDKYDLHEAIKADYKITSTKEISSTQDWYKFIEHVKFYGFTNFDMVL